MSSYRIIHHKHFTRKGRTKREEIAVYFEKIKPTSENIERMGFAVVHRRNNNNNNNDNAVIDTGKYLFIGTYYLDQTDRKGENLKMFW